MGVCSSVCNRSKLTRPSSPPKHASGQLVQKHVLDFTYRTLCEDSLIRGPHGLSAVSPVAGWRCAQCGLFETTRDFVIQIGDDAHVQFQVPLCDACRLYSVIPNQSYSPSNPAFRSFYQLSIVSDLLKLHRHFVEQHKIDESPGVCMVL